MESCFCYFSEFTVFSEDRLLLEVDLDLKEGWVFLLVREGEFEEDIRSSPIILFK